MEREQAWDRALQFIQKNDLTGDIYEFGCYRGKSLSFLHSKASNYERLWKAPFIRKYFAFDSFAGMPSLEEEDHLEGYNYALGRLRPGALSITESQFRTNLANANFDLTKLETIGGFFSDSLKRDSTLELMQGSKCALLHIDCDYESSAMSALTFSTPYLQDGCVLLFDDWFLFRGRPDKGVQNAFKRWLPTSNFTATHYFNYDWCGNAFILHQI